MDPAVPVLSAQAALTSGSTVAPPPRLPQPPRIQPAPALTPHHDRADLEPLLRRAASERYGGREVAVSVGRDEASGHTVIRVVDRLTGEIIAQVPPDELLRFYAASRQPPDAPLVSLRA